jgi:hypothetical protein
VTWYIPGQLVVSAVPQLGTLKTGTYSQRNGDDALRNDAQRTHTGI